jgi:hypothetical protein
MIFSYVRYNVEPTRTIPSAEVHRPMIPVRLIGPKADIQVFGLLDTGADNVFVSASLADVLGVETRGEVESALGAGGHALDVWPGSVEIEVAKDGECYRWPVEIGFLSGDDDPPVAYLGHAGFLEYFNTNFNTEDWLVELIPHEHLVRLV